MIFIVTSRAHAYTHKCLVEAGGPVEVRALAYDEMLSSPTVARGTYILTDFDRLTAQRLNIAARFCRLQSEQGVRILNDPARVLSRYGLLRRLNRAGINAFDAYRVEELAMPKRWPVFLREEGNHGAPVSGLLRDPAQLKKALNEALQGGTPIANLLIVEYAAEPVLPGLFRKLSVFRVGERYLGYTCVHDDNWIVKQGKPAIAPLELYEEEFEFVRDHSFADAVRPAFELAGIHYGRADFGLVGGRVQIYEINTNPELDLTPEPSPVERRNDSYALFRDNYLEALKRIDTA